jgi:hypothetical protein
MPMVLTIFLWLKPQISLRHPAEHGIVFDVVMARWRRFRRCQPRSHERKKAVFLIPAFAEKEWQHSKEKPRDNLYFGAFESLLMFRNRRGNEAKTNNGRSSPGGHG